MEDGIGSFTPASADPKLAAALARSGLNASGFRFTPSEASKDEQHRVTVAVRKRVSRSSDESNARTVAPASTVSVAPIAYNLGVAVRSEERRVGKECGSTGRSRWWTDH